MTEGLGGGERVHEREGGVNEEGDGGDGGGGGR